MASRVREGNLGGPQVYNSTNQRSPQSAQSANAQAARLANIQRQELFNGEKLRIQRTCFDKTDETGKLVQSYITHIRIEEDGGYPSSPPPPDAPPANKKSRVVILAVKSNGQVFMHKARENDDASFQIGKTWPLEELQAIESFLNSSPRNAEEQQRAQWAGPSGFTVTLAKPYFWKAATPGEKIFFIGSLVKVYGKFTNGKVPQLIGFDSQERQQITNVGGPQRDGPRTSAGPTPGPSPVPSTQTRLPSNTSSIVRGGPPGPLSQQRPTSPNRRQQAGPPLDRPQQTSRMILPNERQQNGGTPLDMRPPQIQDPTLRQIPSRERMQPVKAQSREVSATSREAPTVQYANYSEPRKASADVSTTLPLPGPVNTQWKQPNPQPRLPNGPSPVVTSVPVSTSVSPAVAGQWRPSTQTPISLPIQSQSQPRVQPPLQVSAQPQPQVQRSGGRSPEISNRERAPKVSNNEEWPLNNSDRQAVPERRRPPMQEPAVVTMQRSTSNTPDSDAVKPLVPRTTQQEQIRPEPQPSVHSGPAPAVYQGAYVPGMVTLPERATTRTIPGVNIPLPVPISTAKEEPARLIPPQAVSAPAQVAPTPAVVPTVKSPLPELSDNVLKRTDTEKSVDPEPLKEQEQQFRPGLGPMMGKKSTNDVAGKFRKAAVAHGAFKPRAGGAGDRLLVTRTESSNEPDGITGVVPAPSLARGISSQEPTQPLNINKATSQVSQPVLQPVVEQPAPQRIPSSADVATAPGKEKIESSSAPVIERVKTPKPQEQPFQHKIQEVSQLAPAPAAEPLAKQAPVKPRSSKYLKGLYAMGIDPSILEGVDLNYENVLEDLGWGSSSLTKKNVDKLESGLRREIGKLEAGSWLNSSDQRYERVEYVENMLDKAIMECDEMEGLLTLYGVELSTLNDDISYIEAQSQGLQVQTANQKLLHMELQNLVQTTSISPAQIAPLRQASLQDSSGLETVERSLLMLYKAINKIDPSLLRNKSTSQRNEFNDSAVTEMRALQDKKQFYLDETFAFIERLRKFMDAAFANALGNANGAAISARSSQAHDGARQALWQYSPLMMFTKDVNMAAWENMINAYQDRSRPVYQEEVRSSIAGWKTAARKPAVEEQEALFTTQDKESDGSTGGAKRLTVKRSQTLARGFNRTASFDKGQLQSKNKDSKLLPYEVFTGALEEIVPLMTVEQNFVIDFFHITSVERTDFTDAITVVRPSERRGTNLVARRPQESDRAMVKRTADVMENVFGTWPVDMQNLVDWAVSQDAFQGIGILHVLERKRREVASLSQEFAARTLQTLSENLKLRTNRFIDEQVRAIDDTKVKIKKRKGIIAFIRIFPNFSAVIENSIPSSSSPESVECPETRALVDAAYQRINKAMFDSLRFIAKETPGALPSIPTNVGYASGNADPEDKEALNHHILLIENMQYYASSVDERSNPVLGRWRGQAYLELSEHLAAYVSAVIRRPLGRMLDFLDSIENIMSTAAGREAPERIPKTHPSHSRSVFKKVVAAYDSKEIRRGVDTLRRRIEKHFAEADDAATSQKLERMMCEECERRYNDVVDRTQRVAREVYEGTVEVELSKADVSQAFRR